jgi:transposase-like protein
MTTTKKLNGLRNQYSPEFKANIVREILREEKGIAQIAAEHGIHPHQLYQWRDIALQGLPTLFSGKEAKEQAERETAHERKVHELYAHIGKLTTQLEWLGKKAGRLDE